VKRKKWEPLKFGLPLPIRKQKCNTGVHGMSEAINTALSALKATFRKQDVTANNIANANTHDFKKSKASFEETSPAGVKVTISRVETPGTPLPPDEVIGEGHQMSNVSMEEELVDLITTQHAFAANIQTIQTEDEMQGRLLDIIA
jgi:flagellar hook protein FlgE